VQSDDWVANATSDRSLTIRAFDVAAPSAGSAQTVSAVITFFIPQYNEVNGDPALLARLGLLGGSSRVDFVNVSADIRSVRGSVNDTSTVTSPDTAQTVAWGAISAWAGNALNAPPIPGVGFTNTFNFEFSQYVNYTDVLVTIGMPSGTVIDPCQQETS